MLYENLKNIRERQGIYQRRFAELLKIKYSTYCDYENENNIFPVKHLNTLCNELNVSFDYLFNFTNILNYKNTKLEIDKNISGQRIKEIRKENELTQAKLAEILNIALGAISGYENGIYLIKTSPLYTICKKYNISADYLLGKIDSPKYLNSTKK